MSLVFQTPSCHDNYFYGYYTQSPLSADGQYLICHRTQFDSRTLKKNDKAEIGFFDIRSGSWKAISSTCSFNWQQGSMLQWLGPDFKSRVVFNNQDGNHFIAQVADIESCSVKTIGPAIYAVHPSGDTALGVMFERHYFTRAYHYEGICHPRWNVPIHPDDGILSIDLSNGNNKILVSTKQISEIDAGQTMRNAAHWLEHILWNPSGTRFAFLHRYGSAESFITRIFTANADGSNLWYIRDWREWDWSHMAWRGDEDFVLFSRKPRLLGKQYTAILNSKNPLKTRGIQIYRALKRILPKGVIERSASEKGYAFITDKVGMSGMLSSGMLNQDGHPNWTRDNRFMLTDTYALEDGYRHLLLYDMKRKRLHKLGKFYSPFNACGHRCDLHPRLSNDNRYAIIDTVHTGKRQCMVFEIEWKKIL